MPLQRSSHAPLWATALTLAALSPASAGAQHPAAHAEVVTVVDSFHQALQRGDTAAVLALLAADVLIMEGGAVESRDENRSHPLPADIEFLGVVRTIRGPIRVAREGAAAWVSATSEVVGSFKGRRIDSQGAELLVLSRGADGWRIRAIHWSSQPKGQ